MKRIQELLLCEVQSLVSGEPMAASSAAQGVAGMAGRPGVAPRGPIADHSILEGGECSLLFMHSKENETVGCSRAGGLMKLL